MHPVVPTLTTSRLTLRPHTKLDLAACAAMWADPAVVRHVGGRPFTEEETWSKLLRYAGLWPLLGYGYWAVEETATGRFVGDVGLADFHRALDWAFGGAPEAGWVLASWAHGRGFATEAVTAALAWADAELPVDVGGQTVCIIDAPNGASLRVASKCGYTAVAEASHHGTPVMVLRRAALR